MNLYITEQLVAGGAAAVAVGLRLAYNYIKPRLGSLQLSSAHGIAGAAVQAAEEAARAALKQGVKMNSDQKYQIADQALTSLAKRIGLSLSAEEAHALIHTVLADFHALGTTPATGTVTSPVAA